MSRYWHACAWIAFVLAMVEGATIRDSSRATAAATHALALGCFYMLAAIYYRRPAVSPEAPHA